MKQLGLAFLFVCGNVCAMDIVMFSDKCFVLEAPNVLSFTNQLMDVLTFYQHLLQSKRLYSRKYHER